VSVVLTTLKKLRSSISIYWDFLFLRHIQSEEKGKKKQNEVFFLLEREKRERKKRKGKRIIVKREIPDKRNLFSQKQTTF
jgi:hypothetical protein